MKGRMYVYKRVGNRTTPAETFKQALIVAVESFTRICGYKPQYAIARENEVSDEKFPIPVRKVNNNCPPGHFILYPVVERKCRHKFEGVRKPCKKLK